MSTVNVDMFLNLSETAYTVPLEPTKPPPHQKEPRSCTCLTGTVIFVVSILLTGASACRGHQAPDNFEVNLGGRLPVGLLRLDLVHNLRRGLFRVLVGQCTSCPQEPEGLLCVLPRNPEFS